MKPIQGGFEAARQAIRKSPGYFAVVIGPFLVLWLYFGLICSDGYVSKSQLFVERDSQTSVPGIDLGLFNVGGGSSKLDALLIQEFISSRAMLDYLQETLALRAHYEGSSVDMISRLSGDASWEDFHAYFLDRLTARVHPESMIITLEVAAYEREYAQRIAQHVVKRSEEFVNEVSRQMAREQLAFVQAEVDQASKRLTEASADLVKLQRQYEVFSPEAESETSSRILGELQAELAKSRTEHKTLLSYLNRAAPEVVAAGKRVSVLEQQIEQQRKRQVGGNEPGVNDLMLRYQDAQLNVKMTGDLYQAALKSLEVTRLDASRKAKYLVQVSPPTLPDEAELPTTGRTVSAAFVFLNLGYFVLSLLTAVVKDHRD